MNLPYSMEAEQAVLGAAILDDVGNIPKMVEALRPEMFYARQNGEIFSEIVRLFTAGAPVDFVTLLAAVQDAGTFATEEEAKVYLTQLAETVPSLSHIGTYVNIIAEKYRVRQLIGAAKTILEQTAEETDPELLLESAEQKIYQIRAGRDSSRFRPSPASSSTRLPICRRYRAPTGKNIWHPHRVPLFGHHAHGPWPVGPYHSGRPPRHGKTSFALNIATNVAKKQNVPVAIFSLEMTKDQL